MIAVVCTIRRFPQGFAAAEVQRVHIGLRVSTESTSRVKIMALSLGRLQEYDDYCISSHVLEEEFS